MISCTQCGAHPQDQRAFDPKKHVSEREEFNWRQEQSRQNAEHARACLALEYHHRCSGTDTRVFNLASDVLIEYFGGQVEES